MNREKLKRIVESIEAAEKSIKTYSDHKRDIYSTNKDEFEPKVLRKIVARRKMDPESRTKDDDLLDQYETALGMPGKLAAEAAAGERTYDDAAKAAGVSRRTMARQVARARRVPSSTGHGATPHDTETGEVLPSSAPVAASEKEDLGSAAGAGPFDAQETPNAAPRSAGVDQASVLLVAGASRSPSASDPHTPVPDCGVGAGTTTGDAKVITGSTAKFDPLTLSTLTDDLTIPVHLRRTA